MKSHHSILSGYIWTLASQWATRLIGLISTLVLVRILTPNDFGIISIGMLVVGFFDILTQLGVEKYLLTRPQLSPGLLNSCWTLNLLTRFLMVVLLFFFAPALSNHFENPELNNVIRAISLTQLISAFRNIGMIHFTQQGDFKPFAYITATSKLISFVFTLGLAFYFKNYWCLVLGTLIYEIFFLIGTYKLCPFRPRFSITYERDLFIYGFKMLSRTITGYTRAKLDVFLVGKLGATATGLYSISSEFAQLPESEIVAPATKPLFSAIARSSGDHTLKFYHYFRYISLSHLIIMPSIVGIHILSAQITFVVLGERWSEAQHLLGNLSILMLPFSTQAALNLLYDRENRPGVNSFTDIFSILLLATLYLNLNITDLQFFTSIRALTGIITLVFMVLLAKYTLCLPISHWLATLVPPILGSGLMLVAFHIYMPSSNHTLGGLIANIAYGATMYIFFTFIILLSLKHKSIYYKFALEFLFSLFKKALATFKR